MNSAKFENLLHKLHFLSYLFFLLYTYFMVLMLLAEKGPLQDQYFATALLCMGFFFGLTSLKKTPEKISLPRNVFKTMVLVMVIMSPILLALGVAIYFLGSTDIAFGMLSMSLGLLAMAKESSHWLKTPIFKGDIEMATGAASRMADS